MSASRLEGMPADLALSSLSGAHYAGVILAGGRGRRMGGSDKPLIRLAGRSMLERVVERLRPQVASLVINANGDPSRFAAFDLPVAADTIAGFAGPLAGILAGMRWAQAEAKGARYIASVAADTPFFPADLVSRLGEACGDDETTIALAASASRVHPVFGLWPVTLADDLEIFLRQELSGKVAAYADRHSRIDVPFGDVIVAGEPVDPFFNVNTPEDAARAQSIAVALDR